MKTEIADLHVRYIDGDGSPHSESFDTEEIKELGINQHGFDFNKIIKEYIDGGATKIRIEIETEEI